MFLHVFAASAIWMAVRLLRRGDALVEGVRLFALPAVFLTAFYWFDIRFTKIGDGPEFVASEVFVRALSYALGGPPSGVLAVLVALATVAGFGGATLWWQRNGRDEWIFLLVAVFVSPAVMFFAMQPEVFFVRYFLTTTVFGLIALAAPAARAIDAAGTRRVVAIGLVAAFVVGNAVNIARFYQYGRGDYLATVQLVADSATASLPTVGGDHRFRNHNLILFYNRYLPEDRRLVYTDPPDIPEWLLLHHIGALPEVDEIVRRSGYHYALERVARYSDLSGWHWLLYRKQQP
jgi:4-amino-4-deoxy-L-arabinose transferase-like glycosyltransferase